MLPYIAVTALCLFVALSFQTRVSDGLASYQSTSLEVRTFARFQGRRRYRRPPLFAVVTVLAVLVIFAGARVDVGSDFRLYATLYAQSPSKFAQAVSQSHQEIGFTALTWFIHRAFGGQQAIFWISALLAVSMFIAGVRVQRSPFAPSIYIYITGGTYLFSLNGVRQGIAIAIIFVAICVIPPRSVRFVMAVAVACLFHVSAIVGGAAFVAARVLKWNRRTVTATIICSAAILVIISKVSLTSDLLVSLNPKYDVYLGNTWRDTAGLGTILNVTFATALAAYVTVKDMGRSEYDCEKWILTFAAIMCAAAWISPPISRVAEYWSPVAIYVVPKILGRHNVTVLEKFCVYSAFTIHGLAYVIWFSGLTPYSWSL